MNTKVVLEYDGTGFSGWQQQRSRRTVEAELKRALRELSGRDHKVYAAGRTDAGAAASARAAAHCGAADRAVRRIDRVRWNAAVT